MLADTIVKRWQDHMPLNRLEDIYARDGLELARSTMCGWHGALAELRSAARRGDARRRLQAAVPVHRRHRRARPAEGAMQDRALLGARSRRERHVLFEFTRDHTSDAVDDVLAGYQGFLVADAHVVYDHLYATGDVVEVNCWAHCRRYFFKALDSDPDRAKVALGFIGALFRIERDSRRLAAQEEREDPREALRDRSSTPSSRWCDAEAAAVSTTRRSRMASATRATSASASRSFLDDGRLPIHNNMSELALRREAVGRKNWLFVGSDDGGAVNALFTSLLASCRLCDVEPWSYLRDILCLLPRWPEHRLLELAPVSWTKTRARDDVRGSSPRIRSEAHARRPRLKSPRSPLSDRRVSLNGYEQLRRSESENDILRRSSFGRALKCHPSCLHGKALSVRRIE